MSNELVLFETKDKTVSIPVKIENEAVWLNRNQIAELFDRDVKTIGKHINNALREELSNQVVVAKYATTTMHGAIAGKTQTHKTQYYNLDVIISVGYRVKSQRGVEFRQWANKVLRQYILQGYAINQKRLEYLNKTVEIESRIIAHMSEIDTEELLSVINVFWMIMIISALSNLMVIRQYQNLNYQKNEIRK